MREDSGVFERPQPAKLPTDLEALLWNVQLYLAVATLSVALLRSFRI